MAQVIDLDLLDKVGSAKGVEELRLQLKQQVGQQSRIVLPYMAQKDVSVFVKCIKLLAGLVLH